MPSKTTEETAAHNRARESDALECATGPQEKGQKRGQRRAPEAGVQAQEGSDLRVLEFLQKKTRPNIELTRTLMLFSQWSLEAEE